MVPLLQCLIDYMSGMFLGSRENNGPYEATTNRFTWIADIEREFDAIAFNIKNGIVHGIPSDFIKYDEYFVDLIAVNIDGTIERYFQKRIIAHA